MFLHGSVLHGSPFIQRAIETKRRDFFSQLPATFRSRSQGIQRIYFPASSGGLKSLARMASPCSRLLVLFSEYWKGERRGNRSHHPQLHKIMNVFTDETLVVHSLTRDERQWSLDQHRLANSSTDSHGIKLLPKKSRGILDRCILPLAPEAPLSTGVTTLRAACSDAGRFCWSRVVMVNPYSPVNSPRLPLPCLL